MYALEHEVSEAITDPASIQPTRAGWRTAVATQRPSTTGANTADVAFFLDGPRSAKVTHALQAAALHMQRGIKSLLLRVADPVRLQNYAVHVHFASTWSASKSCCKESCCTLLLLLEPNPIIHKPKK